MEKHTGEKDMLEDLISHRGVSKSSELKRAALEALRKRSPEYRQAKSITQTNFGTRDWTHSVEDAEGFFAELDVLYDCLKLYDEASTHKSTIKEAELYRAVKAKCETLAYDEVRDLVVEDEVDALSRRVDQHLVRRGLERPEAAVRHRQNTEEA